MTLIRWQPYRNPMWQMMNRLLDDYSNTADEPVAWSPRIEVVENENSFEVSAELPGLERDDVKVEVQSNILTLSGEKRTSQEKKDRNVCICERAYGSFSRSFQLPALVDSTGIKASVKNGVLSVVLPKAEEAKPRHIEIKAD